VRYWLTWWRSRSLERAELELADAEHHFDKWVRGWDSSPSEVHRAKCRIEKARRRVSKLGGEA
jgi:hypothetical protein